MDSVYNFPLNGGTLFSPSSHYTVDDYFNQELNELLDSVHDTVLIQSPPSGINPAWFLYYSNNLTGTITGMTTAMTDVVRSIAASGTSNVQGDAYRMSMIIHARWGWLALPLASMIMVMLLLLVKLFRKGSTERKHGKEARKGSTKLYCGKFL
jgi:hypothetical protein